MKFEFLSEDHERMEFNCGEEALNLYIRHFARQDMHRELARTFIVRQKEDFKIVGYYTLSSGSIDVKELQKPLLKKLRKYHPPVAHLTRLAVDKKRQGQGSGELLLMDALYRTSVAGENMGIYGMIIDAKHEKAKKFYQRYGFYSVFLNQLLLFAPLKDLRAKFGGALQ